MKKNTDVEIFLTAIEASGKKPGVNYSDRQVGIFAGVTIGMIMVRDNIPLKEATKVALDLRQAHYSKWLKGELKEVPAEA